jgi:signal transduction histidine kinase
MSTETETMTTHSSAPDAVEPGSGFWARYGELWRRTPAEVGVLFIAFPLAVIAMGLLWPIFFTGVGLAVLIVGFFLVLAALYVARGYGMLTLRLLEFAGRPRIPRPQWRGRVGTGFIGKVFGPLADGRYWLYLLDAMLAQIVVSTVTWGIMIAWVATSLGGVTYWIWVGFIPNEGRDVWLSRVIWDWATGTTATFDPRVGDAVMYGIVGVIMLFTLPFVMRGLVLVHWGVAKGLLGSWSSQSLRREVSELSESRAAAVAAEDRTLRRLERDIHDGPQQGLLRLRMDIASAQRRMHDDPDAAARLLDEAATTAQESLDELRALSRGFAPPILQDRGLKAALESLGARSTIPVELTYALSSALPSEIERNLYFVAAELLTNVSKHADASLARVRIVVDQNTVLLSVSDNGHGGAGFAEGHGLAGIRERVTSMRGTTQLASSRSGTVVNIAVPLS